MEYDIQLTEITLVIVAALAGGLGLARLKQPPILGYILAGILLGPSGLGLIQSREQVGLLAELGVLLLLFVVGMDLSLRTFKKVCGEYLMYGFPSGSQHPHCRFGGELLWMVLWVILAFRVCVISFFHGRCGQNAGEHWGNEDGIRSIRYWRLDCPRSGHRAHDPGFAQFRKTVVRSCPPL